MASSMLILHFRLRFRLQQSHCSFTFHFPAHAADHVHILECHPTDPALALSASYDGTLALWDTGSGAVLRRFSRLVGTTGR
jgi:WD40 repeat protein